MGLKVNFSSVSIWHFNPSRGSLKCSEVFWGICVWEKIWYKGHWQLDVWDYGTNLAVTICVDNMSIFICTCLPVYQTKSFSIHYAVHTAHMRRYTRALVCLTCMEHWLIFNRISYRIDFCLGLLFYLTVHVYWS